MPGPSIDGQTVETRAVWPGTLEVRQRGRSLAGSFPYSRSAGDRTATIRNRGRVRKERIGGDAFGWQLERFAKLQAELSQVATEALDTVRAQAIRQELERRNLTILAGHDFNRPLGDMLSGTARARSTREAFEFEVELPDPADQPSYMRDTVAMVRSGLARGISPGFRVRGVPDAEAFEPEPGNPGVQIRVIRQAILPEMSIVTRPSYSETAVDMRAEDAARAALTERRDRLRRYRPWL
ncbi:HK97 family phage prohead protease [Candidatus Palauibacter sp.]|uniref:HK97 family phage prohead protease n=1 Tax=Candidatus Palauibacter sp. TaxID=3101350 RepID=UPI003B015E91